ncbi:chorismate lyase [Avibacterium sp. 20-15]|uniref:chorismate--pyruvate lyase family protein n=1 Tax=unclassified Avibacterium TaxID=2685287 RepID=UPI0020262DA2|nr:MULTISPECIES: chorismate lyase [unclassified Avibacterium]MCW9733257.1 chorismate lyase [Avibacterium sp. 20-15]URL05373.1 chorismate lyase [Avibacterium sp. 20-132]
MNFAHYRQLLSRPDWQTSGHFATPEIAQWIQHQGSLTQKLQQACQQLSVEVIHQGWQTNSSTKTSEKSTALNDVWLREVLLKGDDIPWIFAQTRLPKDTVDNVAQYVLQLDNEPIGLWLFKQPIQRTSLYWRQDPETGLYARYSDFDLKGYVLQIKELFLDNFSFPV